MKSLTGLAFVGLALMPFSGCQSNDEASIKVVLENRPKILVSDLPQQFLDSIDTSSERAINAKLSSHDSLTLDGTVLTVAAVGDNRSVTLVAHTIKLINGARIVTNGNQLSLVAMKMQFNNSGGIDSFVGDNVKAAPTTQGADAAIVQVYATELVMGSLRVSLAGQAGGDGATGAPGTPGRTGDRGSDAADKATGCGSSGGNGGPGGDGGKGLPGGPGATGGNGADLILLGAAAKHHEEHFIYQGQSGVGGTGGAGGPGGAAGLGGQAGNGSHFCGTGVAGNPGQPGPRGDPGKNGANSPTAGKLQLK